jgi:DNA-directed RNA polymerase subunit RPC12/RpoP
MGDKTPKDPHEGVRRFLTDFRSHTERRSFEERRVEERRASEKEADAERRSSEDRRDAYDRREMLLDRRRSSSEWFIREHAEFIREALLDSETEVACPRCKGDLLLGPSVQKGDKLVRDVHCTVCRHRVLIAVVPKASGKGGAGASD